MRFYVSLHDVTAEDIKVTGSADLPTLRIGKDLELHASSHGELVAIGQEITRQARMAQALANQSRTARLSAPIFGDAS